VQRAYGMRKARDRAGTERVALGKLCKRSGERESNLTVATDIWCKVG